MSDKMNGGALPVPDRVSEPIVAFYLTQETDLPAKFQGNYQVVAIKIPDSLGRLVKKPALRVTFYRDQSIEELVELVRFGCDPRCHVLLPADFVSPMHCRIYAQLNSGPRVWLVDDSSTQGTQVQDDETAHDKLIKTVHGRRQASLGLRAIRIGPYTFQIRAPVSHTEVRRCEDWFRLNKSIPVTRSMLDRQLDGHKYDWLRMNRVGKGGNGQVYMYMEKCTALCVAIKEEELQNPGIQLRVKKEVKYMETLHHPYLVDFLFSECNGIQPVPTQYTAMPLYLGDLWALLSKSPDIQIKERVIIQVFEGLSYVHGNQVLHRDLKPDNIFWVTESPVSVKIGDYGLATSLADHHTLFDTCGTAAYMAPEVFRRYAPQTKAIDVFSLGATVFAILESEIVMRGWYTRGIPPQQYNRVFENVANSPPKLYAGLVQSMMAPEPSDRPSLDLCTEIVKGQHYSWIKGTQLAPVPAAVLIAATEHDTPRPANAAKQGQTPLDRARALAIKRKPQPIAPARKPEIRREPKPAPAIYDYKYQQIARLLEEPKVPPAQVLADQARKPSDPAPVQGVNFQDGLPSYEEATGQIPFVSLPDSHEIARKRPKKSKKKQLSQPLRRSREHAMNMHRAQAAGVHKPREQLERQAARNRRVADLKKGVYDVAKGYCIFYRALIGLACEGLVVGSERIYRMLNDISDARNALEHAAPSMKANAQLVTSMQRHSLKAALSNRLTARARQRRLY